jgi:hypothetical protein
MVVDPVVFATPLLSQFPYRPGQGRRPRGPNNKLSFQQTYKEEGNDPDAIFELVIDEAFSTKFQTAVADHVGRPIWDWNPMPPKETHCARAAYDALRAGGVPIDPRNWYVIKDGEMNEILPNSVWRLLEDAGFRPIVKNSENLSLRDIQDNENAVAFARANRLWNRPEE